MEIIDSATVNLIKDEIRKGLKKEKDCTDIYTDVCDSVDSSLSFSVFMSIYETVNVTEIIEDIKMRIRDLGENKYARVVFEVKIPKDATLDEIEDLMRDEIEKFILQRLIIDSIEICDTPYDEEIA